MEGRAQPHRASARFVRAGEGEAREAAYPAAIEFVKSRKLNEFFGPKEGSVGIITLGGLFNGTLRALEQLGLADVYGGSWVQIYVLDVAYPIVEDKIVEFCRGEQAILMVEEGAPDYLEQALNTALRRRDIQTKVAGKDVLPMGGEYTAPVMVQGVRAPFLLRMRPSCCATTRRSPIPRQFLAQKKSARRLQESGAAAAAPAFASAARSARSSRL